MTQETNRGRPKDTAKQAEQKQKLIDAANVLMREKSYRSVTIRELGAAAGVNSAMIKYYFGGKEELFLEAMNQMVVQHFSSVQAIQDKPEPVKGFIKYIVNTLNQDKGLAKFIHDEVLNENYPLRDKFLAGFPSQMAELLPALIEREVAALQAHKAIKGDVNCKYAAFNLMSMIMMPYVAAPIRKIVWQICDEQLHEQAWVDHLYQQFIGGIIRGQSDDN
ncbi:TetR/AcrR family transcriptional regulator [Thalassotalea euphylliae]|uniref:TetR/AcrR family transcriptional regulator n=1 Tax=Thalassotalea euphylliae TaxID=1655234 RepID=A0A3E0UGP5_9GAMM|nr:TetR/AcrR family transcriptional regulator [Thalassotalea euphylliae]REL35773.1 TetR/AcrR family transcriptional regulator [Thalassotalea euphylliae]